MNIPNWYGMILLTLAAWRTWALLSRDLILDGPRNRLFPEGTERRDWLECPYCSGFWVWAAWLAAWWIDDGIIYAAVVMAGSAVLILIEKHAAEDED